MANLAVRLWRVGRAFRRRGGFRYLGTVINGVALPRLVAGGKLPRRLGDAVVRRERRSAARPWHAPAPDQGPPASRFSHPSLKDDPADWRLAALEAAINLEHAAGHVGLEASDVVFDEAARAAAFRRHGQEMTDRQSLAFETLRDRDRRRLAETLQLDILHRTRIVELIEHARRETDYWYSPIDFGRGITTGGSWSTETGSGRWDFLNGRLVAPIVRGRRVLELGTNNGIGGLMMLKAGALHVSAIEYEEGYAEVARLAQRILSWADLHNYPLDVKQGDMRVILDAELPEFDVVTAYCSLYYLEAEEMAAIVRRASQMADTMILQSNDQKHRGRNTDRGRRASTAFTRELALGNGFSRVEVHQPPGYPRALLIARR